MFWNKFMSICNEKGVSPTAVVTALHVSNGSITHWKNGTIPNDTTIRKIADYFGVSPDYFYGTEAVPADDEGSDIIRVYRSLDRRSKHDFMSIVYDYEKKSKFLNMFWDKFVTICNEKGTSPTAVATALHLSTSGVTKWKNGAIPNDTTIRKITDYFGVSLDYFSEAEIVPPDDDEADIIRVYHSLDRRSKHEFMSIVYEYEKKMKLQANQE